VTSKNNEFIVFINAHFSDIFATYHKKYSIY